MSKGMLGTLPLSEVRGPRDAFEEKLAGEEGEVWLAAFKRFLRKENPWPTIHRIEGANVIHCGRPSLFLDTLTLLDETRQLPGRFIGTFCWESKMVALHLDSGQQGGSVNGTELRKRLAGMPVLPSEILDHLLAHPELIPEEWKQKRVFFWGSIYSDTGGCECVRYLHWTGTFWRWRDNWLDHEWSSDDPAAVLKS